MYSPKAHFTHFPPKLLSSSCLPKLHFKRHAFDLRTCYLKPILISSKFASNSIHPSSTSSSLVSFHVGPTASQTPLHSNFIEETLEKVIYRWRFVTLLGVLGSLIGSALCFVKVSWILFQEIIVSGFLIYIIYYNNQHQINILTDVAVEFLNYKYYGVTNNHGTILVNLGCAIVATSFIEPFAKSGKAIVLLVEAIDVYLLGTVMLVFGMGIYELFVSNLDIAKSQPEMIHPNRSNLFGLFTLLERPGWLEIKSVNELKTKVGHVIVLLLLIGLFDKSKKAAINTPLDLVCFSASVFLCSGGLYLLSKLNGSK
ncbi:hypothetical protein KSS87_018834 [Heliosperma pusillum]|nr:hypothetical protein KSS87_018834 [Heliosperma pusillum]